MKNISSTKAFSTPHDDKSNNYRRVNNYKKYKQYQDSVFNVEKNETIQRMAVEYETEKKEAAIASLSQQAEIQALQLSQRNQTIVIGFIVFVLVITSIYLIYNQRSTLRKRKQIALEQRFLRSQLNPHFISNGLVAIQSSLMEKDVESAGTYLTTFARLMREILENSRKEAIPLEDEISMLTDYLDINKRRLKEQFEYTISVDDGIDKEFDMLPPMLIQPFAENAIDHGIVPKGKKLKIQIDFTKQRDRLEVTIRDNGGGLQEKVQADKNSLSIKIIRERIALFNQSLRNKINLEIDNWNDNKSDVKGVQVVLSLPLV